MESKQLQTQEQLKLLVQHVIPKVRNLFLGFGISYEKYKHALFDIPEILRLTFEISFLVKVIICEMVI